MIRIKTKLYRGCSGVVIPLLVYTYLVSDIFTEVIKSYNCLLHSSLGRMHWQCQAQPGRHAAAVDADSEAHRFEYQIPG